MRDLYECMRDLYGWIKEDDDFEYTYEWIKANMTSAKEVWNSETDEEV